MLGRQSPYPDLLFHDPFARLRSRYGQPSAVTPVQQPSIEPAISPEAEQSLLGGVMSGVQYLGETLDKPGAAVRGTIAGKPEALLNLIPFSDMLGITKPEERTTGKQLAQQWGMIGPDSGNPDWSETIGHGAAGFGVELALDPLLWVTGPLGALTKSGQAAAKAARAAGKVTDMAGGIARLEGAAKAAELGKAAQTLTTPLSYANQLRTGQRALLGLGAPWQKEAAVTFGQVGQGGLSEMLAKGAATGLEKLTYGGGPVSNILSAPARTIRALHSTTAGARRMAANEFTGPTQIMRDIEANKLALAQEAYADALPAMSSSMKDFEKKFMEIAESHKVAGNSTAFNDYLRSAVEFGFPKGDDAARLLQESLSLPPTASWDVIRGQADELERVWMGEVERLEAFKNSRHAYGQSLGLNWKDLDDEYVRHARRDANSAVFIDPERSYTSAELQRLNDVGLTEAREKLVRNIPGGTTGVNRMSRDPLLTHTKDLDQDQLATDLRAAILAAGGAVDGRWNVARLQEELAMQRHIIPQVDGAIRRGKLLATDRSKAISKFTTPRKVSGEIVEGVAQTPTVSATPIEELTQYFAKSPEAVLKEGLYPNAYFHDTTRYMAKAEDRISTAWSAHNFLHSPGVVREGGDGVALVDAWKKSGLNLEGLNTFVKERLRRQGVDETEIAARLPDDLRRAADRFILDPGAANALKSYAELTTRKAQNALLSFVDRYTSLWRGSMTTLFPAFHGRNLAAGLWQSWTDGKVSLPELLGGYWRAIKHVHSRGAEPFEYLDEMVESGVFKGHGQIAQVLGEQAAKEVREVPAGFLAGVAEPFMPSAIKAKGLRAAIPLPTRGVFKGAQGALPEAGERLYSYVEFLNRGGYYDALRRKGFSPSEASHFVKRAQFDYTELSAFDKSVMRRALPFWTWIRKNVPYQITKLLESPGGKAAQTYRAINVASGTGEDSYTPQFLREGMATKIGGTPDATTFLRAAGLPIEDLNRFVFSGGRPSFRTLERFAANLHPALTAIPEYWADKQLFSGRKLTDLEPLTGNVLTDKLLMASPISRGITSIQQAVDPRKTLPEKALNLLSGIKFGTYDVEKSRLADLRDAQQKAIAHEPYVRTIENVYVPKDKLAEVDPETLEGIQRIAAITKAMNRLKKKRKLEAQNATGI